MAGELDTSGRVWAEVEKDVRYDGPYSWDDLSPFEQGYLRALFLSTVHQSPWKDEANLPVCIEGAVGTAFRTVRFSDLSPEALALILEDCAVMAAHHKPGEEGGREFWNDRQSDIPGFPPLRPFLSEDGKIHLRPAGGEG